MVRQLKSCADSSIDVVGEDFVLNEESLGFADLLAGGDGDDGAYQGREGESKTLEDLAEDK